MADAALIEAYKRALRSGSGHIWERLPALPHDALRVSAEQQLDFFATKMANQLERTVFQSPDVRREVHSRIEDWLNRDGPLTLKDLTEDLMPLLGPNRAALIARTETGLAYNAGQAYSARAAGFTHVVWVASPFACDECLALDGQEFTTDTYAQEPLAHPNCGCTFDLRAEDIDDEALLEQAEQEAA